MKTERGFLIGKNVVANCPYYNRGKQTKGIITGIKYDTDTTVLVIFEGNKKSTSISTNWLTIL